VYDIVLAERSTSYGFLALFQRAKLRIVAQQGATDLFPNTFLSKLYKGWIQKRVYRKSDLIHAWGQTMYRHMDSIGVDPSKIILRPKGIDLSVFKFEPFHSKPNEPCHLIVTRSLEWYYRHDLILQAIAKLKSNHPKIILHIVGDGSQRRALEELTRNLELIDCVVFHGRLNQVALARLLAVSRIYISAPTTEGYSSSLMEAMACGCIPVITDLPSNRESVMPGVNGFLFENGNHNELLHCLEEVLNFKGDLGSIADVNRKTAEDQFDVSKNMKHFWKLYMDKYDELNTSAN
ncbi:MAG: glycosyltransferase family 1 protein, partial [Bacteroidota bacterium]